MLKSLCHCMIVHHVLVNVSFFSFLKETLHSVDSTKIQLQLLIFISITTSTFFLIFVTGSIS